MSLENTYILADFDATLTKAYIWKHKRPSLISVLRDNDYLWEEYARLGHEMYNHYAPIEKDQSLSFEERKAAMEERRGKHLWILIEKWLSTSHLQRIIDEKHIQFRNWFEEFFWFLHDHYIPLIIISASGLGVEMIEMMLQHSWVDMTHIHVISNQLVFWNDWLLKDVKKPYIHGMNKDETEIKNFGFDKYIQWRENIVLLGDSLNDLLMARWATYDSLYSFGFLNDPDVDQERITAYEKAYDRVIRNDWDLYAVLEYLKNI